MSTIDCVPNTSHGSLLAASRSRSAVPAQPRGTRKARAVLRGVATALAVVLIPFAVALVGYAEVSLLR